MKRLANHLRTRWLWWQHTWWFQFAHGPLCAAHDRHVFHVGTFHLCRSCACLYATALITLVCLLMIPVSLDGLHVGMVGLMAVGAMTSYPPWYRHLRRGVQDVVRAMAGVLAGGWLMLWLRGDGGTALIFSAAAGIIVLWFRRLRTPDKCHACHTCHELDQSAPCSGYVRQAEAIRRYEIACEALLSHDEMPACLKNDPKHTDFSG